MRIILSNHARLRSISRGITYEEICNTILAPEEIEEQKDGVICYKKKRGETQVLLVCAKDSNGNIIVITVISTSKISKYLHKGTKS